MPVPTFTKLPPFADFDTVKQKFNKLTDEMSNLMLNLDSLNVTSITTETLIVYDLTGGGSINLDGNGMVVNNGAYDTFVVDINGNVTMTSALIRSANGYPYVELDPVGNLFGAYLNATNYLTIEPGFFGAPAITFDDSITFAAMFSQSVFGANFIVSSNGDLTLDAASNVNVPSWTQLYNLGGSQDLQTALDAKATAGSATSTNGLHNHGIPDGTVLMVDGGGTVTFSASGSHSHTQT